MRKILAILIRFLNLSFKQGYYYPLLEKRILSPFRIFKNTIIDCRYDETFIFRANLNDWIQHHVFFMGYYDLELSNWIKQNVKPGSFVFDIGANVGVFALLFSKRVGDTGKVFAIEPYPANANALIQNLTLNEVKNVSVLLNPLGKNQELVSLEGFHTENQGMVFTKSLDRNASNSLCTSMQITGDNAVGALGIERLDIIKIDAEAHDIEILWSLEKSIFHFRPLIILEFQSTMIEHINDLQKFTEKFSYEMKTLKGESVEKFFVENPNNSEVNVMLKPLNLVQ